MEEEKEIIKEVSAETSNVLKKKCPAGQGDALFLLDRVEIRKDGDKTILEKKYRCSFTNYSNCRECVMNKAHEF